METPKTPDADNGTVARYKNIALSDETYDRLVDFKLGNESWSELMERHLEAGVFSRERDPEDIRREVKGRR